MAQIGNISVKLGLVTVDFDKATDGAKQKAKALQDSFNKLGSGVSELNGLYKQLGGTLAVGSVGMAALIAQTASFADRIQDLADGMGISTGFALQLNDALMKAGLSGEVATKVLGKLYENIDSARQGNQTQIDQFRKLGITFTEIKELKPEDAIRRVIASLAELQAKDPVAYVAELRKQLGKGGLGLDAQELDSIIAGGLGNWEKYGKGIKDVSKVKDQLTASMNNLMIAFANLIGPLAHNGTVSVEKFTGALAGMATFFVASKVITYAAALTEFVIALRAATAAGAAFNIMATGSPLMLALKLAALGTAFLIYQKESGQVISNSSQQNFSASGDVSNTEAENSLLPSTGKSAASSASSDVKKKDEMTPEEKAASIALQTERIKSLNTEARNSVDLADSYTQSIVNAATASSDQFEALNAKRAELNAKYKNGEPLLGIELGKLKEQEKQIISNTRHTIAKLQYDKEIADTLQEQTRQEGYYLGRVKMSEEETNVRLEQAKVMLSIQEREIDNQTDLNTLRIQGSAAMGNFAKSLQIQSLETQRTIGKLDAQLKALPDYIDMPDEMLSKEARANNQKINSIKSQIEFEQERHNLKIANLQNERTYEFGVQNAIQNFMEQSMDYAKVGADSFASFTGNISSAIDTFVKTGKLSFKDLARSIIQDLIAIQMKAQANSILSMILGVPSNNNTIIPMQPGGGYADGGQPPVGKVSLVGERGPELFVPSGSGTVIPNHALGGLGGTTNVTNNYINAIDTKSFEERLLGSSTAIWAANKYGEKSLATSYGRT
jgi:lambda family phage tail tape measure protein